MRILKGILSAFAVVLFATAVVIGATAVTENIIVKGAPWYDVRGYSSFSAAAAAASGKTIIVYGDTAVTTSVDASTCAVWFVGSGKLTVSAGRTVQVGPITAPQNQQIFAGDGLVIPSAGQVLYSDWWPSFAKAVADIGSEQRQLVVTSTETISGNLTVPTTLTVDVKRGGSLAPAGATTTIINGSFPAGSWQCFGGSGTITFGSSRTVIPEWFGTGRTAFQSALSSISSVGGIVRPNIGFSIDPTAGALLIYSNTTVDLNGTTITRTGTNYANKIFTNAHYGVSEDTNITIKNGTIIGTGAVGTISDQGAAIGLYMVDGWTIENIKTVTTNGDGIQYREAHNGLLRNVDVGDFGRNGISPTSGLGNIWENVTISGDPITGANPGADIDAENNTDAELSQTVFRNVKAANITLVDMYTAAAGVFAHKAQFEGCRFGPGYRAMRFQSTNATVTKDIVIDDATLLHVGSLTTSMALYINNVSGICSSAAMIGDGTATTAYGIFIDNAVDSLFLDGVKAVGTFNYGLIAFEAADVLSNAKIRGCDLQAVYFTGTDNIFENSSITNLTISQAASIGNIFGPGCRISGTTTFANSATSVGNVFATPILWTPVVKGTTGAGTATYTTQVGYCSVIGNTVYFNLEVIYTGHTGTGNVTITGLPITSGSSGKGRASLSVYAPDLAFDAGKQLVARIQDTSAVITLYQTNPANGATTAVPMDAAATMRVSGFYFY